MARRGDRAETKRVRLTKRSIDAIEIPATGRTAVHDTDVKGFCVLVTAKGARTFVMYRRVNGEPKRVLIGRYPDVAPEAARKIAEQLAGEIALGNDPDDIRRARRRADRTDPTVADVFAHTLENYWKPRARTWREFERIHERYTPRAWLNRRLSDVSKVDLLERHAYVGREHGIYTSNRWRGMVHRLFEVAIDDFDYPGRNPVRSIDPFPEQERERFVTKEEMPRLIDAIDDLDDARVADFLRLALFTGARRNALLHMRFADIDVGNAVWTIPPEFSKNKKPIHIPLVPAALEVIRLRRVVSRGNPFVFPGRRGVGRMIDPSKTVQKVFKAAGLEGVRLHDIRRSNSSWQAAEGSSEIIISKSLGHRRTRSTGVYTRLTLDPVRASVTRATDAMAAVVAEARAAKKAAKEAGK